MVTKLYLSAERVSREDEFEHHLQIARDRNLGIEIKEFYLPVLMWGNWKPCLEKYKQLLRGFDNGLSIHNAFYCIDHAGLDPEIFRLTRMRYDYIFKIAQELGCGTIVSHFRWLPRYKGSHLMRWQEAEVRFWDTYINKAEKIGYMHVHNNHGEEDSHNPLMDGTIDFEQLFERLDKWQAAPIIATEIYGQGLIESIDYLEKKLAATQSYGD